MHTIRLRLYSVLSHQKHVAPRRPCVERRTPPLTPTALSRLYIRIYIYYHAYNSITFIFSAINHQKHAAPHRPCAGRRTVPRLPRFSPSRLIEMKLQLLIYI